MCVIDVLKKTPFSLVLSGGGALGIAHVGVIEDMDRLGLVPDEIIGTSMGGIIGACVAIGMKAEQISAELEKFAGVSNWFDMKLRGNSIISDDKIKAIFEQIFRDRLVSQAHIPLKLIATDLLSGDKHLFSSSEDIRIVDALLATMAIPGIFKEQYIKQSVLGDGFLCENLGILEAQMDTILAVDVMSKNSFKHRLPDNFFRSRNVLEMLEQSVRMLINNQTKCALAQCEKQVYLLEPDTSAYKTFHFTKIHEIKVLGKGLLEELS